MIYAIDYGTSNSLLGAASAAGIVPPIALDPSAPDPTVMRSVLYFPSMSQLYYGMDAVTEFARRDMEGRLIRSIKKYLPIRSFVGTYVQDRPVNLEDLVGFFLGELRRRANAHFERDVDSVVLGRPARFAIDDADDQFAQYRLERAARSAGFKHIEFCPEPLAAAFEFRLRICESKTVLVADFGGGTSDFTVIRLYPPGAAGRPAEFQASDVLAIGGVSVAGDLLDGEIMRKRLLPHFGSDVSYTVPFGSNVLRMPVSLMEKICSPADISLLRRRDTMEFFKNVREWSLGGKDREKMDRLFCLLEEQLGFPLFEEIDATKRRLSETSETTLRFDYPSVDLKERVSRGEFEEYTASKVTAILDSLDETMKRAQVTPADIDLVCATGGTAKVPIIHEALVARFGREKIQQHNHFHSVARGLCERAKQLL